MGFFKEAEKSHARAKIALTGPSGAGKTLSALLLAKGLGGKTGVIDSENDSASLYADKFGDWKYHTLVINPPYTAQKYLRAIDAAIAEGIEILIVDSLTHVWAGEGGLLQQKEALDSRGGNSYTNWGAITKLHEQLKSKILLAPIHIIATMRSKQEYILEQNDKGKSAPKKVGLAPIQRDGMEYEFTVVFDIGMDHQYMVSKDRTGLFDGVVAMINEQTGADIRGWLTDEITFKPETTQDPEPEQAPVESQRVNTSKAAETSKLPEVTTLTTEEIGRCRSKSGHTVTVSGIINASHNKARAARRQTKATPAPAPATNPGFDPADYVIPFGEKLGIKGLKIRNLTPTLLRETMQWADEQMKGGRAVPGSVKEFKQYATDFMISVGEQ